MKLNGELNKREQTFFINTFHFMDRAAGVFVYVFAVIGVLASLSLALEFRKLTPFIMGIILIILWFGITKLFQLYIRRVIQSIEETGTTWKGFFKKGKSNDQPTSR